MSEKTVLAWSSMPTIVSAEKHVTNSTGQLCCLLYVQLRRTVVPVEGRQLLFEFAAARLRLSSGVIYERHRIHEEQPRHDDSPDRVPLNAHPDEAANDERPQYPHALPKFTIALSYLGKLLLDIASPGGPLTDDVHVDSFG
jgi:hypothetical protein